MVDLFDNLSFGRLYEVGPIVAGDSRGEKELRGRWSLEILRILPYPAAFALPDLNWAANRVMI